MKGEVYSLLAGALLCGAWTTGNAADAPALRDLRLPAHEAELLRDRLQDADRPRLGLAMSGGGIRSSLFNIGVLKALYDQGVLDDVDIVSSVSGGSYTTYWLYTNQMAAPGQRFGYRALDDRHFPERVCEIITEGNFVRTTTMARYFATGVFSGFAGARSMYQNALVRTYGDQDAGPINIDQLAPLVAAGQAPYLVVNASTRGRNEKKRPWQQRLFEFTPLHYGNGERGYSPWEGRQHPMQVAAVTSGAAVAPLSRRFESPWGPAAGGYVKLYDGGKTENLGAVAPLLRGTGRLIVVDAQLDKESNPFEAYFRLKKNLQGLDIDVSIPAIDADPRQDVSRFAGTARSEAVTTQLDYIKMRIPASLRAEMAATPADTMQRGADFKKRYYDTLEANQANGSWSCGAVAGIAGDFHDWLLFDTAQYMKWSEGHGVYRTLTRALPGRQEFPEHSTVDQSFYLDQAVAYIGLGYLVTMRDSPVPAGE